MKKISLAIAACIVIASSFQVIHAAQTLTTSRSLNFRQTLGSYSSNSADTPINITTITPSYSLQYEKTKLKLNADYSLIASKNNQLNNSKISHRLKLKSTYDHIPNTWSSTFLSSIIQKNSSYNGRLVSAINTTSAAAKNYLVTSVKTARTFNINSNVVFNSSINLSSQGFEDASKRKNLNIIAKLNALRVLPSINLTSSFNGNKNLDSKEEINNLKLTSTYIINAKLNTFVSASQYSSSNDNFEQSHYQLGFNWDVTPNSRINLSVGKLDKENSWSSNSFLKLRRLTFSLNHSEGIKPANSRLLSNLSTNNNTFANDTSSALKLIKSTTLKVSHKARRLTSSLSISNNEQFSDLSLNPDRSSQSTKISFNYSLSRLSSVSYSFSNNKIKTTINNQLSRQTVNWSTTLSRQSSYNVSFDLIEQNSGQSLLDYQRKQLNFNYRLLF